MLQYRYKAALPSGEVIEGTVEASDRQEVIRLLQSQGKIVIRADKLELAQSKILPRNWLRPGVSGYELATLIIELATLLQAGMALDKAIKMLADASSNQVISLLLDDIHEAVRAGNDLSDAMARHPQVFSEYAVNIVKAGELGGLLAETLYQLGESLEHRQIMRQAVLSKLMYPLILLFVAGLSIVLLLTYVIPQFNTLFEEAQSSLPWLTRIVMASGYMASQYGWLFMLILIVCFLGLRSYYRTAGGRIFWDKWLLRIPLLSDFIIKLELARFTHALAVLLKNGVPLLQSVSISSELVTNRAIATDIHAIQPRLEAGEGLSAPLSESFSIPDLAVNMIKVGEESGQLAKMLDRISAIYEREVDHSLNKILVLIEPVMIIGLGLLTATIILSILMAILSINELVL